MQPKRQRRNEGAARVEQKVEPALNGIAAGRFAGDVGLDLPQTIAPVDAHRFTSPDCSGAPDPVYTGQRDSLNLLHGGPAGRRMG